MKITIVGLGKMGQQIALKLKDAGHDVFGIEPSENQIERLRSEGLAVSNNPHDAVAFFEQETPVVWLMIPAGVVDQALEEWFAILPAGSIVIDGGNSDFRLTKQRAAKASEQQIALIDCGTSGGVHGLVNGFSLMIGGPEPAYQTTKPIYEVLASPHGALQYFGGSGSGHYVKMVHNAVEYGMMQSLSEGYQMLHDGDYAGQIDLAAAGEVWQHGSVVVSWLNQLCQEALAENPELEGIDGFVAESGEARWTLEAAAAKGIKLPSIQTALDVRVASQNGEVNFATKLLAAMRNKFGGHTINKS